jgi:1A family penicillin-binding protein
MPIEQLKRVYGEVSPFEHPKNQKKFSPFKKAWIKKLVIFGITFLAICFIGGTGLVLWVSRDLPDPEKLNDRSVAQSTKIYDRTGTHLLYEVFQDQKRTLIELSDIAPLAVKATIAVEDKHFYEHKGVRLLSIIRAGVSNLLGWNSGGGGASTLTQQLIKNAVIGDEHSYYRKIKEAILALRLEKKYNKDQILKLYFNEIPYGSTNYGIESAAQSYFQKSAKNLTLAEGATLAALPQLPSYYLNNLEALKQRRDLVLRLLNEQGYITEDEKTQAQAEPMTLKFSVTNISAPHFVLYVKQLLADQFGEKTVDQGGLKVITTLDWDKQKIAENAVTELGNQFAKEYNANNAALVALDPKTGQILSMVGSRDYNNDEIDGQFNVAVLGERQPGSSFKPFVYLAGFEKGYTPDTVLYDVVTNFDRSSEKGYIPKNYDGAEHGLVTVRQALQLSLNIPAVKMLYLVGGGTMQDFGRRFGYTTFNKSPEYYGLSLVLGGAEVNLLEHTNGYATLANSGVFNKTSPILKVTDTKGDTLYEWKDESKKIIEKKFVDILTNVLTDDAARASTFGRGGVLTLPGRPVAAKTGTTNDSKDSWTLGYTPSLTAGVWVGNTTPATMKGGGSTLAGKIWHKFMDEALKDTPVESFPLLPPNDAEKPILRGTVGGIKVQVNKTNDKIATSSTPESLIMEKEYLPAHTILHYVYKDDPRGLIPDDPSADPQYDGWEIGLADWIRRETEAGRVKTFSNPPTEYDITPINPELVPTINILQPTLNQILTDRNINITVEATAPRGVVKVFYKIDGNYIGESNNYPFNFSYYAQQLTTGIHILTAVAEDDQGNPGMSEAVFNFQAGDPDPYFNWVGEAGVLKQSDFPKTFYLDVFRWDDIDNIKVYLVADGVERLVYTFDKNDELQEGNLEFIWKKIPDIGDYVLKAVMTDKNNKVLTSELKTAVE